MNDIPNEESVDLSCSCHAQPHYNTSEFHPPNRTIHCYTVCDTVYHTVQRLVLLCLSIPWWWGPPGMAEHSMITVSPPIDPLSSYKGYTIHQTTPRAPLAQHTTPHTVRETHEKTHGRWLRRERQCLKLLQSVRMRHDGLFGSSQRRRRRGGRRRGGRRR